MDLFDCKPKDSNQIWAYRPEAGASLLRPGGADSGSCLTLFN